VEANNGPVDRLLKAMTRELGALSGKTIAVWGLAFKPRTDDVREAPGLRLVAELSAAGATVRCTDPQALETARQWLAERQLADKVELFEHEYDACRDADALVIATEWNEYRSPNLSRIKGLLRGRWVFDGRNALVPEAVTDAGLCYHGMGRPRRVVG
jgi:UDPglucose 6-dehydrogenase